MLATCMMNSLKANNKLINGKSNRKPRMEEAGDESGSGCMFTSAASENRNSGLCLKIWSLRRGRLFH